MLKKRHWISILAGVSTMGLTISPIVISATKTSGSKEDFYKKSFAKVESEFFNDVLSYRLTNVNNDILGEEETKNKLIDLKRALQEKLDDANVSLKKYEISVIESKAKYMLLGSIMKLQQKSDKFTEYRNALASIKNHLFFQDSDGELLPQNISSTVFKDKEKYDQLVSLFSVLFKDTISWTFFSKSDTVIPKKTVNSDVIFISWQRFFEEAKESKEIPLKHKKFLIAVLNTLSEVLKDNGLFDLSKDLDEHDGALNERLNLQIFNLLNKKAVTYYEDISNSYGKESSDTADLVNDIHKYFNTLKKETQLGVPSLLDMVQNFQKWLKNEKGDSAINGLQIFEVIGEFLDAETSYNFSNSDKAKVSAKIWSDELLRLTKSSKTLFGYALGLKKLMANNFVALKEYNQKMDLYNSLKQTNERQAFRVGINLKKLNDFISKYSLKEDFEISINKYFDAKISMEDIKVIKKIVEERDVAHYDMVGDYVFPKDIGLKWSISSLDELHFSKMSFLSNSAADILNTKKPSAYFFTPIVKISRTEEVVNVEFKIEMQDKKAIGGSHE